jgi:CBS domain-containing protein
VAALLTATMTVPTTAVAALIDPMIVTVIRRDISPATPLMEAAAATTQVATGIVIHKAVLPVAPLMEATETIILVMIGIVIHKAVLPAAPLMEATAAMILIMTVSAIPMAVLPATREAARATMIPEAITATVVVQAAAGMATRKDIPKRQSAAGKTAAAAQAGEAMIQTMTTIAAVPIIVAAIAAGAGMATRKDIPKHRNGAGKTAREEAIPLTRAITTAATAIMIQMTTIHHAVDGKRTGKWFPLQKEKGSCSKHDPFLFI